MDIEEYIEKIVENGRIEDMEELSDILEDVLEMLEESDPECYKKYKMKLYKMANGSKLDKAMAEEIVSKMRPYRMRWSIEETKRLQEEFGIENIDSIDFFVVINSAFNDYRDIFNENIEDYVKFSIDFIEDEDAKKDKVFLYFTTIVEE